MTESYVCVLPGSSRILAARVVPQKQEIGSRKKFSLGEAGREKDETTLSFSTKYF